MNSRSTSAAILASIAVLVAVVTSAADIAPTAPPALPVGADQAAEIAREHTGGRILDVKPAVGAIESAYEVRVLLNEGRVRKIVVDVQSGQVE